MQSVGTNTVAIMCGEADSSEQTNQLMVEGTPVRDATPYDADVTNGCETGSFNSYVLTMTVNDGKLTLVAAADSLAPKLNFVEISGPNPAALDQATHDPIKRSLWSGGNVEKNAPQHSIFVPDACWVRHLVGLSRGRTQGQGGQDAHRQQSAVALIFPLSAIPPMTGFAIHVRASVI